MSKENAYLKHSTIGLSMGIGFTIFAYGGYWIDQKFFDNGVCLYLGLFLGLGYCALETYRLIKEINKDDSH